jgi:cell wall-associated NlpC family hydrolase
VLKLAVLAAAVVLTSACASTGAVPRPFPMAGAVPRSSTGTAPPGDAAPGDMYALVGTALSLRGTPYRNGGADPNGFDCSGFTQFVFARHGLTLPRAVSEQYRAGSAVSGALIDPGDLVFFSTTDPGATHVGIAIGGDQFVHAPSSTGVVRVEHLGAPYWSQRFVGARRLAAAATQP